MGKHQERHDPFEFDDDSTKTVVNDIEYDIDDEAFFEQFKPTSKRPKNKHRRDARRRIEEYWENRKLADRLDEYYYHSDD
jgi:hypothetical protein